jgi:serine/threonine-protein kinase PRP4
MKKNFESVTQTLDAPTCMNSCKESRVLRKRAHKNGATLTFRSELTPEHEECLGSVEATTMRYSEEADHYKIKEAHKGSTENKKLRELHGPLTSNFAVLNRQMENKDTQWYLWEEPKHRPDIGRTQDLTIQVKSPSVVDIFAATPLETKALLNTQKKAERERFGPGKERSQDTWDDSDGYYNFAMGEIVDGRYEVFAVHGRGVFSTVLRARDLQQVVGMDSYAEVAIKVIRANEPMTRSAQLERVILNKLALTDPENKRHVIKLIGHFDYRKHVCLIFEPMDMNLRACVKKFGRDIGLSIHAVRAYTIQLLISLNHLKNNGVLHADTKPDNILVNHSRTLVKLGDFGSAMFVSENEVTPYLVSRFYRAPEVILGLPYDTSMDIWAIGCVIYELFTGRILFPGRLNNEMIKLIMDVKGPFPKKMLRKGAFVEKHFDLSDPSTPFYLLEEDPLTNGPVKRVFSKVCATKNFSHLLSGSGENHAKVVQLSDLLEKLMVLDPEKRLTPIQALKHPFCVA